MRTTTWNLWRYVWRCGGAGLAAATLLGIAAVSASAAVPDIRSNDNHQAAGKFEGGVLALALETGIGTWRVDGADRPGVPIQAFAEVGQSPQVPGPLIRVPAGTEIRLSVRNALADAPLTLHGLFDRPAESDQPLVVPSGETKMVRFRLSTPGTYYYWGSTTGKTVAQRMGADSQLSGAIVVDPPGAAPDPKEEVLVFTEWLDAYRTNGAPVFPAALAVVNGRSWPATQRFEYTQGDTVKWRWINLSFEDHPLHLHGFYFRLDSRGDGLADTLDRQTPSPRENTVLVQAGETRTITWVASRAGQWLFHCHHPYHVRSHFPLDLMQSRSVPFRGTPEWEAALAPTHEMGGLVLGVTIQPKGGTYAIHDPTPRRRVLLTAEEAPESTSQIKAFRYALGDKPSAAASPSLGPPIVLTQGVPVAITVRNRLPQATTVHWHGIELESAYYDGVAEFGGDGKRLTPMIHPGQEFKALFTPPRPGTFIYHTHMNDVEQLEAGLAGPLIVLPPGETFDSKRDHIIMVTTPRPFADQGKFVLVNGVNPPAPIELKTGARHRFRLINMHSFEGYLTVEVKHGSQPMRWRALAKDGRSLPKVRQTSGPARQLVTQGETYDFEFVPSAPGDYTLELSNQRFRKVLNTVSLHVSKSEPGPVRKSSLPASGSLAASGDWPQGALCAPGSAPIVAQGAGAAPSIEQAPVQGGGTKAAGLWQRLVAGATLLR
ncbi:MAG: multicopper oxidase domain-containing protein [Proteobacteria bacterium]|nr:multicopper oxidase domain-containing protein [Pseudomonadota bacterium]